MSSNAAALAALTKMAGTLRELKRVPEFAVPEAAEGIQELLAEQFAQGRDPYGLPWAPLKPATLRKGRRPPPLSASGALRNEVLRVPQASAAFGRITLTLGPRYGAFHQTGTRDMAQRLIFPEGRLPARWERVIAKAVQNAFERRIKSALQ
jgi:hypothetical protein